MKIPITFLGTGQAVPTAKRNHTAMLLQYKNENILVDCGENTQQQFRKAKLNPCKITRILITHWHGDHILGLPGLLQTLALQNYNKTLYMYMPKGTKKFMKLIFKLFVFVGKIKYKIIEIEKGKVLEASDFIITSEKMHHQTKCLAYSFKEKDKLRLNKAKLRKLKLPGKLIKKLQQGKNINWKGKTIKAKDIAYKQKGKKITFILDTKINKQAIKLAKNSDLLICESTYTSKEKQLASKYKHLTAEQAAIIAKKSGSRKLILTHISQRYQKDTSVLMNEAKKVFKNVSIAEDLMKIEI